MASLKQLWDALEDSPRLLGVRQELLDSLGGEYPVVAQFLDPNGKISKRYPCPFPGDPGCPRRVVKESADRFRAVCAAESRECDPLRLSREDVQVLAFDENRFARALQQILGLPASSPQIKHHGDIVDLGVARLNSKTRLPVVLLMASSRPDAQVLLSEVERTYLQGAVLLTPTDDMIDGETESRLRYSGFIWIVLANILRADGTKLTSMLPISELVGKMGALTRGRTPSRKAHAAAQARAARRQAVVNPLLQDKRWTPGRLVTEAGLGKNSVYQYLDGTRKTITKENREAIADALGIQPEQLPE